MIKVLFITIFVISSVVDCQVRDEQQYKKILRQMCEKFGSQRLVGQVENSIQSFVDCFYGLFEPERNEIGHSNYTINKQHCAKSHELKTCLRSLTCGLGPCMNDSFYSYGVSDGGVELLINYIYYKDGDEYGLFFPDDGPECFQEELLECARVQIQYAPTSKAAIILSVNVPHADFNELSACVVTAMTKCSKAKRPGSWPSPCCHNSAPVCHNAIMKQQEA